MSRYTIDTPAIFGLGYTDDTRCPLLRDLVQLQAGVRLRVLRLGANCNVRKAARHVFAIDITPGRRERERNERKRTLIAKRFSKRKRERGRKTRQSRMQMRLIICEERYKGTRRQRVRGRYFKRLHLEPRTSPSPPGKPSVNKTADKLLTILVMHPRVLGHKEASRSLLLVATRGPNKTSNLTAYLRARGAKLSAVK